MLEAKLKNPTYMMFRAPRNRDMNSLKKTKFMPRSLKSVAGAHRT